MKKFVRTLQFRRSFHKRIRFNPKLYELFWERAELFFDGDTHITKPHALTGKMYGLHSFSVTSDIRVIYKKAPSHYIFIDIGSHKQVYRK